MTLTKTRTMLVAASASLTALGLAGADEIDDLTTLFAPERATLRYATTSMAVESIARKPT